MEEYSSSQGMSSADLKHSSNLDDFRSSIHNLELQLAKSKEENQCGCNKKVQSGWESKVGAFLLRNV